MGRKKCMADMYNHTVLIVDDDKEIGSSLGQLINKVNARFVYSSSAVEALTILKNAPHPFSLILSDYMMPGLDGIRFLSKAKALFPDTIRFLFTGYADIDAAIKSVNQGAVHRFISKPWDNHEFLKMVKTALRQYELIQEDNQLFSLAKRQNASLYALSQKLKKQAEENKKAILQKEEQIELLKKRLEGRDRQDYLHRIDALLKEHQVVGQERIRFCHTVVMADFFSRFKELAARNGFFMFEEEIPQ